MEATVSEPHPARLATPKVESCGAWTEDRSRAKQIEARRGGLYDDSSRQFYKEYNF